MSRRVTAGNARDTLVAKLAKDGDTTVQQTGDSAERASMQKHKELVRAAGRAAVEESLRRTKRKASEMTPEGIVAQWQAYAEVYGTNGMAAGGARSSLVDLPGVTHPSSSEAAPDSDSVAEPSLEPHVSAPSDDAVPAARTTTSEVLSSDNGTPTLAIWDF